MAYNRDAGKVIQVEAVDDSEVSAVLLGISDAAGSLAENGTSALVGPSSRWVYLTQTVIALIKASYAMSKRNKRHNERYG